jgi:SAM-dependent methyltransferase
MPERDVPSQADNTVHDFYERLGWELDDSGATLDARLWEDLRPAAGEYVSACRRRVLDHLPERGELFLDGGSGPVQYDEYLAYSLHFNRRVCVDFSIVALKRARQRLQAHGLYVCADISALPFRANLFDAVVSMHVLYHVHQATQEVTVRELLRVSRVGTPTIIVYANPDRLSRRLRRLLGRQRSRAKPASPLLYYHAYQLAWWRRFKDRCGIEIFVWRTLVSKESASIPGERLARLILRGVLAVERRVPRLAARFGAYPMIVLKKKSESNL